MTGFAPRAAPLPWCRSIWTDFDKIDQLGQSIFERFGRLDIVVGNAATLGDLSPISHFVPKTWDRVFALNVTANYRLIRSMDRLLRGSDAGRAVFVTSGVARHAVAYFGAYAASKAALEMMVKMYALEVATSPLKVNLLDPGIVRTKCVPRASPAKTRCCILRPKKSPSVSSNWRNRLAGTTVRSCPPELPIEPPC